MANNNLSQRVLCFLDFNLSVCSFSKRLKQHHTERMIKVSLPESLSIKQRFSQMSDILFKTENSVSKRSGVHCPESKS